MIFSERSKINLRYIIIVVILAIIISGGVLSYQKWFKFPKTKPPVIEEENLAKDAVNGYVKALMTRQRDAVLPYLTGEAKEKVQKWPPTFGTSNPHLGSFEIINSKKLDTTEFEFVVREYQEYTGEGVIGYNDETLILTKVGDRYLISSIQTGEYVAIKEITGWKTYKNEKYGFEINYLKDWEVRTKDASYWCQEHPEYDCLLYIQFFPPSTRDTSWINLVVYGNIWRKEGKEVKTNGCKSIYNYLLNGKHLFVLSTCVGLGQEKTEEIYDQMLSTFRFLE
jgi:hypothetical protein